MIFCRYGAGGFVHGRPLRSGRMWALGYSVGERKRPRLAGYMPFQGKTVLSYLGKLRLLSLKEAGVSVLRELAHTPQSTANLPLLHKLNAIYHT